MRILFAILLLHISLFGVDDTLEYYFPEENGETQAKRIISIEIGKGEISRPKADTLAKKEDITRDIEFGAIKLGAEDLGMRLFLSYRPMEVEKDIFTHSFGLELDSMVDISSHFRFFYGLVGGVILYQIEDKNSSVGYTKDSTGYYGLEGGFIIAFTENYELEIGGRYSVTNINNDTPDSSYIFDRLIHYYLAFNYRY
ncbi:MAG TPA: hypothetical protein EYO61_02140 [Campylobacterales bacterium]|nr:hypothetical protein [Campylobacterales bacterium]